MLNILCVGDIIGASGVEFIKKNLWNIRKNNNIGCVVANGENSANGNGIDPKSAGAIFESGVDVITTGNHVWQKNNIYDFLDENKFILRPANFPDFCPGAGYNIIDIMGYKILFINLLGTVFMEPGIESGFITADRIFLRENDNYDFAVIDIHAEATSEKNALAKYIDGKNLKAGIIFGTHTHVQTADEKILKNGAGYITDLGMTGPADSVLGIKNELIIQKFLTKMPVKFEVSDDNIELQGIICKIETETKNFKCVEIKRINFTES
ncbi:MAG: TIGR00282 family metallophosphoesterase [Oscillospiraceae bacterium]|nr:TIGR00282 family metallophosphoesterase [Oscillospiraceae bacterium]